MNTNKVIDFTKKLNEKELEKIPQSKTKQKFLEEIINFMNEQEVSAEEDFFEFLLLIKTELQHLREKNVVTDYKIDSNPKNREINISITPSIVVDRIDMNVIVSTGEYDQV